MFMLMKEEKEEKQFCGIRFTVISTSIDTQNHSFCHQQRRRGISFYIIDTACFSKAIREHAKDYLKYQKFLW